MSIHPATCAALLLAGGVLSLAAAPRRIVDFGADTGGDSYRSEPCSRAPADVDGDGAIAEGEQVTGWPLRFDVPLSPRFPEYDEDAASAVFFGGLVGFGTAGAGITEGMNNENHELRDDFNAMAQAERDNQKVRARALYFWDKRHFLNGGDSNRVAFGPGSRFGPHISRFWNGLDDARWVARDGAQFFISEARFATDETFPDANRGGTHTSYVLRPDATAWAPYDPRAPHDFAFDPTRAAFAPRAFTNVTAVGFYLARNRLATGSQWVKWYAFEAYAEVESGEAPRETGAACWLAPAPVPYALWRRVWKTFVSNARCRDISEGYVFARDGDMGAMDLADGPHHASEPATDLTWLDAVVWCNAYSEYEGLEPCYYTDMTCTNVLRRVLDRDDPAGAAKPPAAHWKRSADGYRLPTPAEWSRRPAAATPSVREWCWDVPGDRAEPGPARVHAVLGRDAASGDAAPATTALPHGETPADGSFRIGFRVARGPVEAAPGPVPAGAWTFTAATRLPPAAPPAAFAPPATAAIPAGGFDRARDGAQVTLSPFQAARTETTFREWSDTYQWAVNHGYRFNADGDMGSMDHETGRHAHAPDEPVTDLCWEDMVAWCNALSERAGLTPCYTTDPGRTNVLRQAPLFRVAMWQGALAYPPRSLAWHEVYVRWHADGYRLPTQAEWQHLYREGKGEADRLFPWQEAPSRDRVDAVPADLALARARGWIEPDSGGTTHAVGGRAANAFGLFDLDGNVAERVWDWPGYDYYRARNPKGGDKPTLFGKVVMGSCFGSSRPLPVNRSTEELPAVPRPVFGFRVVRCEAGAHPVEEKLELRTALEIDPARFDPLQGRVARANLRRSGLFQATGVPQLHGIKWRFRTGGAVRAGAVAVDGRIFVGSLDGTVYALDAATGAPCWTFKTDGPVRASVAVVDGTVYATSHDRHLYALDAATGALRWKARGKSPGTTAPAVAYGLVFAGYGYGWSGELVGLRVADGQEAWRYRLNPVNGLGDGMALDGERLFTPIDDIQSVGVDLRTEYRLWTQSGTPTRSTMPVDDTRVYYAAEGRLAAFDKRTGERAWTWFPKGAALRTTSDREPTSSPALAGGLVVQGWFNGQVAAVTAEAGEERWIVPTGAPVLASPAVAGETVYVANDDGLVLALGLVDGAERWRQKLEAPTRAALWPGDGVLYVGCDDGSVVALQ